MSLQVAFRHGIYVVLCLCTAVSAVAAEREVLNDLSARIQFDSYAADVRALQRDLQSLKQLEVATPNVILQQYYLAYGHMRLAETLGEKDRSVARKSAGDCVKLATDVIEVEPKRMPPPARARLDVLYAELWAIRGACVALEANLSLLPETSIGSAHSRQKARTISPNNPRVQLLAAIHVSKRADNNQEFAKANQLLIAVTQAFDSLPSGDVDLPDWGQADAWAWLGYGYLKLGDKAAARNALERAILLTPDYAWARSLQSQLNSAR